MPTPTSTPVPRHSLRAAATSLVLAVALMLPTAVAPAPLSAATISTFVPIGAGYAPDTLQQFAREAAEVDTSGVVSILVLPIAYGVDPSQSWERFEEAYDLVLRAWTEPEPFGWEGKHYQFRTVSIWPRPLQEPHPPIFMSGG